MVKLVSVRESRKYGPEEWKDVAEDGNAFAYVVATCLLVAGTWLLLPGNNSAVGLLLWLIGLTMIISVNVHDLLAEMNGINFRFPLLTMDLQLALIEVAAPLLLAIGGIVYLIGIILFLRVSMGTFTEHDSAKAEHSASWFLVVGPILWLIGSIHNAFQVFERVDFTLQLMQKAVSLPFIIASTLLLVSGILNVIAWPTEARGTEQEASGYFAIAGVSLLALASILNAFRIAHLQQIEKQGGGRLEPLRGGAQELVDEEQPLLSKETETPYKNAILSS